MAVSIDRRERDRLVDAVILRLVLLAISFVATRAENDVLNRYGKLDNLLGEWIVENPACPELHVLDATVGAGELDLHADVPDVDPRQRRAPQDGEADEDHEAADSKFEEFEILFHFVHAFETTLVDRRRALVGLRRPWRCPMPRSPA